MGRRPWRPGRRDSLLAVAGIYAVALAVAWGVFEAAGLHPLWNVALGMAAATAVTSAAGLWLANGSVFDPWWSVLPPWAVLYLVGEAPGDPWTPRQVAVAVVVGVWALRLTTNWARDWPGLHHEDWRYAKLYAEWPLPRALTMVLGVQVFPTVVVWLGCLPLFPALVLGGGRLGALDGLAFVVGLAASGLELVADEQMRAFRRRARSGEVMDRGLWRWSRHPNYFGEILFWVSLWLFALAAAPGWWWTGIGALAMVLMFVLASVPMLDERSRERRPGFAAYAARTPALIPRPPRRTG